MQSKSDRCFGSQYRSNGAVRPAAPAQKSKSWEGLTFSAVANLQMLIGAMFRIPLSTPLRLLPKGMDISGYSQLQLNAIARQLNQRPRKTLGFHTPAEMFSERVALTG